MENGGCNEATCRIASIFFSSATSKLQTPWSKDAGYAVGKFARERGATTPTRLVSSAKSWLCHPGVDRTAPLLPWAAPPEVNRLSPLAVSAKYLRHLVDAWNNAPGRAPDDHLEHCPVVLTVPATGGVSV